MPSFPATATNSTAQKYRGDLCARILRDSEHVEECVSSWRALRLYGGYDCVLNF